MAALQHKKQAATVAGMMTVKQVADAAHCSRQTVFRAIKDGALTAKRPGHDYLIEDTEGQRWAAAYQPYAAQRTRTTTTRENQ